MFQWCEADSQQPDFVPESDYVPGVDAQWDFLDVLQIFIKLCQQTGGGVLLQAEQFTNKKKRNVQVWLNYIFFKYYKKCNTFKN